VKKNTLLLIGLFSGLLINCAQKPKITTDQECQNKYQKLNKKYLAGKYGSVKEGYNELLSTCTGTTLYESVHWELASSYFLTQDWSGAEQEYLSFKTQFPSSDSAELAHFRLGVSQYKQIPIPAREQSKTQDALKSFDEFLLTYTQSPHLDSARFYRKKLRHHLLTKDLLIAKHYEISKEPQSANLYYKMIIETYPDEVAEIQVLSSMIHNYNLLHQYESSQAALERISQLAGPDSLKFVTPLREKIANSQIALLHEKEKQNKKRSRIKRFF